MRAGIGDGELLGADADADARGGAGGDSEYGGEFSWYCGAVADGLAGAANGQFRRADKGNGVLAGAGDFRLCGGG